VRAADPESERNPEPVPHPVPGMPGAVRAACAVGGAVAMVVLGWVLSAGRLGLAVRPTSDFFDAQARAWLAGRWDLPFEVLRIEAFEIDGKAFTYFGAAPALLRLPGLVLADALGWDADGRLAQPFMAVGLLVALVGVAMLWWRVRCVVRGPVAVSRTEVVLAAVTVAAAGVTTVLAFLASQGTVYHEAIIWGVAFALVSFAHQVRFAATGGLGPLAWAGVFALLALLSRPSVGGGPVASLAALGAVWGLALVAARWRWSWGGRPVDDRLAAFAPGVRAVSGRARLVVFGLLVVAATVPVVSYAMVNTARFGEPFRLPVEAQVLAQYDPLRVKALEDNDNNLFGAKFVPTTAWTYLRPNAVSFSRLVPWVQLPAEPTGIIGDATFDARVESTSVTVGMPVWLALAAVGAVTLALTDRRLVARGLAAADEPAGTDGILKAGEGAPVALAGAVRLPALGAVAGAAGLFVAGFTANRYLGDTVPVLVLFALVGLHRLTLAATRTSTRPAWVNPTVVAAVVMTCWGVVANVGMAVEYQRLMVPWDSAMRYDFLGIQHALDGHRTTPEVVQGPPDDGGRRHTLLVVGDCEALLWSDGTGWWVIEGELPPDQRNDDRQGANFFDNRVSVDPGEPRPPALCRRLTN
jgi:hypothetical protein